MHLCYFVIAVQRDKLPYKGGRDTCLLLRVRVSVAIVAAHAGDQVAALGGGGPAAELPAERWEAMRRDLRRYL